MDGHWFGMAKIAHVADMPVIGALVVRFKLSRWEKVCGVVRIPSHALAHGPSLCTVVVAL